MKTYRINGGTASFWRLGAGGWEYEVRRRGPDCVGRLPSGHHIMVLSPSLHAFGSTETLVEARRFAHRILHGPQGI